MLALLKLQLKTSGLLCAFLLVASLFLIFNEANRFNVTMVYMFSTFLLMTTVILQKEPIRHLLLSMPIARRILINSIYVFHYSFFTVLSLIFFVLHWQRAMEQADLFHYLTVFIYASTINIVFLALQLWFYFTDDLAKVHTSYSYLSLILALAVVMLPMMLLSSWSPYAILLGPLWSCLLAWWTWRSACRHFEQKEIRI